MLLVHYSYGIYAIKHNSEFWTKNFNEKVDALSYTSSYNMKFTIDINIGHSNAHAKYLFSRLTHLVVLVL